MRLLLINLSLLITVLIPYKLTAQTQSQNSGWGALFYSQKFNDKVGLHFDFQLRSADDFEYLKNILIRPGITWFIDDNKNVTLGYALILTNQQLNGAGFSPKQNLTEHRIWQQFIYSQKINKIALTHRFRLEQRFIETNNEDVFSNRIRYFFRTIIPLKKHDDKFENGLFTALQNEIFIHLQNKDQLNGHTFDQNRAYIALGYRLSPKIDIEAGYLNQAIKGRTNSIVNNAVQIALYTRF